MLALFAIILVTTFGCGEAVPSSTTTTTLLKNWTVMLFCSGDNDLEQHIFNNLVELQVAGSSDQVNMVAQADWWHNPGTIETWDPSTSEVKRGVARWYIKKDATAGTKIVSTLVGTYEEFNTGTAEAIRDFAVWSAANYPASHYLLIIGSHGDGWRNRSVHHAGFGQDYTDMAQSDIMSIPSFKRVLPAIKTALGKNLDILGIDCCLNGAIEVSYEFKDYVDLLVASEDVIPGYGFPFTALGQYIVANPTASAEAFAKKIVDEFQLKYQTLGSTSTLAVIDLSKITTLTSKVKSFTQSVSTPEAYMAIRDILNITGEVQYYYDRKDFRDLWHFADAIIRTMTEETYASITVECASIKTAVESAVLASKYTNGSRNVSNSHGITIYAPTQVTYYGSPYSSQATEYATIGFSTAEAGNWAEFLRNLNLY